MAHTPSSSELHEMAKERSRRVGVSPAPGVSEQLARIKENKKIGKVEQGTFEHLTVDFFDLTGIITDIGSRVVDHVSENGVWNLLVQGTTKLGVTLQVNVRLSSSEDKPLLIADFHPILES